MASHIGFTGTIIMAERRGLAASGVFAGSNAVSSGAAGTVGAVPRLLNAMERFANEHTNFESTAVCEVVRKQMASAKDINAAAIVPLKQKVFNFETALLWGFFLMHAVPRILSEEGAPLSPPFDVVAYNAELVRIYDQAVETNVWEYCAEDESSSDASGSEEE